MDAARALLRCGPRYYYTEAVTSEDRRSVSYSIALPNVCTLAGLYHTHLALTFSEFFSDDDVKTAQRYSVPSFMGLVADGSIYLLDPARAGLQWTRRRTGDDQLVRGSPLPPIKLETQEGGQHASGLDNQNCIGADGEIRTPTPCGASPSS
jgi:hypothetical protein